MKKRMISLLAVPAMVVSLMPSAAVQAEMDIKIGDYVQMGTYYGKPILWRCVDIDENGPLVLSDKVLCIKTWDANGDNTSGSHGRGCNDEDFGRINFCSNYWADSNIHDWLNSESSSVIWSCGNPPDKNHIWGGYNAYDEESGFLTNFTQRERNAMLSVTQKSLLDGYEYDSDNVNENYYRYSRDINDVLQNYDTAYSEWVTEKMFLLDVKQLNSVYNNLGDYYTAYPTQECVDNSEYKAPYLNINNKVDYWLRSPYCDGSTGVLCVLGMGSGIALDYGTIAVNTANNNTNFGIRPAFYLNLEASSKGGAGSEYDPYIIDNGNTEVSFGSTVSDWAESEIEEAYSKKLIPDVLAGKDLTKPVNREEFAAIAVSLYEKLSDSTAAEGENPFNDIESSSCRDDILKAYNLNITDGITDSTFEPNLRITREQAAAMLTRAYKKSEWADWNLDNDSQYALDSTGVEKFGDDEDISDWAKRSVYFMAKNNIINGIGDGNFAPKANSALGEGYGYTTREQALIMALRSANKL